MNLLLFNDNSLMLFGIAKRVVDEILSAMKSLQPR